MGVPSGQIAARGVAWESQATTVASAHDGSALLCEDRAAAAGSRRGAAAIGSGDMLYKHGDAPRERAGTVPRKPAGTAPLRRAERVLQRRAREAAGIWNRSDAPRRVSVQCVAPDAGAAPAAFECLSVNAEQVSLRMIQSALLKHRSTLWMLHCSPASSISNASY
jgi:hypothetical protein